MSRALNKIKRNRPLGYYTVIKYEREEEEAANLSTVNPRKSRKIVYSQDNEAPIEQNEERCGHQSGISDQFDVFAPYTNQKTVDIKDFITKRQEKRKEKYQMAWPMYEIVAPTAFETAILSGSLDSIVMKLVDYTNCYPYVELQMIGLDPERQKPAKILIPLEEGQQWHLGRSYRLYSIKAMRANSMTRQIFVGAIAHLI